MGLGGQRHTPAALPPRKARYPLYRRLGGTQGRFGQERKISPPPGFDSQTVQPVARRYTDYAIPSHTHTHRIQHQIAPRIVHSSTWRSITPSLYITVNVHSFSSSSISKISFSLPEKLHLALFLNTTQQEGM